MLDVVCDTLATEPGAGGLVDTDSALERTPSPALLRAATT